MIPKKKVKTVTSNSATVHKRMVYYVRMLIPLSVIIFALSAVIFHKFVLMRAVDECPFIGEYKTLGRAKAEREYALVKATLHI